MIGRPVHTCGWRSRKMAAIVAATSYWAMLSVSSTPSQMPLPAMMNGVSIYSGFLPPCPFWMPPWSEVMMKMVSFSIPASSTARTMRAM